MVLRTRTFLWRTQALRKHPHAFFSSQSNPDYVVVGAGSAGSVIAARLAEAGKSVTLLEAGHSDRSGHFRDFFVHMPTALAFPMASPRYNWGFLAEPEPILDGRRVTCPRGKGLGGSSSINGMVYVRGHPQDFEAWEKLGAKGWGYKHVLPYFRKAENWQLGDNPPYRGSEGPLHVKFGDYAANTPLFDAFIRAGIQAGYGTTEDYNGQRQEGFSRMPMTVFHSGPMKGLRCSTASAYLRPALKKHGDSLKVETQAMVRRILFDDNEQEASSSRAIGLEYTDASGKVQRIIANKEVILSAGSIQTPQLLQVSGIGDPSHLESIQVPTRVANPNVGQNLQDHLELYFQQEVLPPISIAPVMSSYVKKLQLGIQWILTRTGLGATNHFESAAFVRSSNHFDYPNVQFHFLPVGVSYDGVSLADSRTGHSMQIHVGTCRSPSRGHVLARSRSMQDAPTIRFNYMSHQQDWEDMRDAIGVARQVMRQPALEGIVGDEILPGKDADLDEYIKEHVESAYHPCGTCKMGSSMEEDGAVVDPQGRVLGVQGLRVADASVFPQITNGNLNAPVIMVGERMADVILGKSLLAPVEFDESNRPWESPTLEDDRESTPLAA